MIKNLILLMVLCAGACAAEISIDADYPGGNIIVERIDGDTVMLQQDLRDNAHWWFYWSFRLSDVSAGRTLTFRFANKNVFGTQGPAVSVDDGLTWSWLGTESVKGNSFNYTFPPDTKNVRFAFALPYQEADLKRFLARHEGRDYFAVNELCKTRKGRSVERIHIGKLEGQPKHRALIVGRSHACECTASYVVEGLMEGLLADTKDGQWLRENVEVMIVPFVDKDGVEDGDQGKGRKPRDHNRDYEGQSLYPSVRTLRTYVPNWSAGRLSIALDFHCPSSRDNKIFQVGGPDQNIWAEQKKFGAILQSITDKSDKSLPYEQSNDLPFGKSWNKPASYKAGKPFGFWAGELEGIRLAGTFEIPYANAGKVTITPDNARVFGADIARAMRDYLESRPIE